MYLKEVYVLHLFSQPSPAEGGSPTEEATKKLVSDVRDQLLQGLADNAETIRQVVESSCPSVFLPYQSDILHQCEYHLVLQKVLLLW